MKPFIIIGSGLAAYTLAREFRKLDKIQPITLITADDGSSYSKPMLSNALSKGKQAQDLVIADAPTMASQLEINIITNTRVTQIDPNHQQVTTTNASLPYNKLILATGANPIAPPIGGNAAGETLQINNLQDYGRFRERLENARSITIIGAGLIGCEFANDLVAQGYQVHVIGMGSTPLDTLIPPAAGEAMQAALANIGIHWHLGTTVDAIDHASKGYRVSLTNSKSFATDLVISAIGLRPETILAKAAGLDIQRGIVTNRYLQTSVEDIYALGDCAELEGQVLPFVMPLMTGARALARTLAGNPEPVVYPAMPVIVKTPGFPLVIVPASTGEWRCEPTAAGLRCLKFDAAQMVGFCLGGDAVSEKQSLVKQLQR